MEKMARGRLQCGIPRRIKQLKFAQHRCGRERIQQQLAKHKLCSTHLQFPDDGGPPTALLQNGRQWKKAPTLSSQMTQSCSAEHLDQTFVETQRQRAARMRTHQGRHPKLHIMTFNWRNPGAGFDVGAVAVN